LSQLSAERRQLAEKMRHSLDALSHLCRVLSPFPGDLPQRRLSVSPRLGILSRSAVDLPHPLENLSRLSPELSPCVGAMSRPYPGVSPFGRRLSQSSEEVRHFSGILPPAIDRASFRSQER
jgi:hypothetical protein